MKEALSPDKAVPVKLYESIRDYGYMWGVRGDTNPPPDHSGGFVCVHLGAGWHKTPRWSGELFSDQSDPKVLIQKLNDGHQEPYESQTESC